MSATLIVQLLHLLKREVGEGLVAEHIDCG